MTQPEKTNVSEVTNAPTNKDEPGCLGCLGMIFILYVLFSGCSSLFTSDSSSSDNNSPGSTLTTKEKESIKQMCKDPQGIHEACKKLGY